MKKNKVLIIAEAGVNHNGSLSLAKKLVDVAVSAGCDIVKFQTFKAEDLASAKAPKAKYQKQTTDKSESQLAMLKKLELPADAYRELKDYCLKKKIEFLSTPFESKSLHFLMQLGLSVIKVPSGEVTNWPFLHEIGKCKKKVILSTGMADLKEVVDAVDVLVKAGTSKKNITVLHCHTDYPTDFDDVNLLAMNTIAKKLGVKVGYSDHTPGIEVPIAAVALGACVIEKHFTLDKNMEGPDHKASLNPQELKAMVVAIRHIEKALGDGIKKPTKSEISNKSVVRKSIVAAFDIEAGSKFTESNLIIKRPGTGISPQQLLSVIGLKAKTKILKDSLLRWEHVQ